MGRLEMGRQGGEGVSGGQPSNVLAAEGAMTAGDDGFIAAGFILGGLSWLMGRLDRRVALAAGAGVLSGTAMALGHNLDYVGVNAVADLDAAGTAVDAKLIEFDREREITVARAFFDVTVDAQNIKYKIDSRPFDLIPDCTGNKQLRGVGVINFAVPFEALRQRPNPDTHKADIEVDPALVTATAYWEGAGPVARDYTFSGGKKNFADRSGFCRSVFGMAASHARVVNLDSLGNIADDLDQAVNRDVSRKGLEVFSDKCPEQLEPSLHEAIEDSIRSNVATLDTDGGGKLGDITFRSGPLQWSYDEGPSRQIRRRHKLPSQYEIRDFVVDNVSCSVDPAAVPKLLGDER